METATPKGFDIPTLLGWMDEKVLPELGRQYPEAQASFSTYRNDLATVAQECAKLLSAEGMINRAAILTGGLASIIDMIEKTRPEGTEKLPSHVKKGVAMTLGMALYEQLDGPGDRIKLPYVPAGISNRIERWVLQLILDWGLEAGVAMLNRLTK